MIKIIKMETEPLSIINFKKICSSSEIYKIYQETHNKWRETMALRGKWSLESLKIKNILLEIIKENKK